MNEIPSALKLPQEDRIAVNDILKNVDNDVFSEWLHKLVVKDGKLGGMYFEQIKTVLGDKEFFRLYSLLGLDAAKFAAYENYTCFGNLVGVCGRLNGYICDPAICAHQHTES